MKIQQLLFFSIVSKYESFSNAANELYISQSSLSKQIIAMEKELGVRLFDRSTRHIRLTEVGKQVLIHAQAILGEYETMSEYIKEYEKNSADTVRLGGLPILYPYGLASAIFSFEEQYPQYHVDITETLTPEVLSMLTSNKLDMGVVRFDLDKYEVPDTIRVYPLIDDRQVLVAPPNHALADRGSIRLCEAAEEQFIQLNTDSFISGFHLRLINSCIPHPNIYLTAMKMDSIKNCITQKGWVSVMMKRVAESYYSQDHLAIIDLEDPDTVLTLCLIVRKDAHSAPLRYLIDFLTAHCKGTGRKVVG